MTVTGWTNSSFNFPITPGACQTTFAGGYYDGFVTRYDAPVNGTANRSYSTYVGASDDDQPNRVALDGRGSAIVAGFTASTTFPTSPGCLQPGFGGGSRDGFVAKLTVLPIGGQGVVRFGAATPACAHPIWQDVDALPLAGSPFAVRAHGGPPNTAGAMLVGLPRNGVTMFNYLQLWLGAGGPLIGFPAQTGAGGCASTPLLLSTIPPVSIATQWVFLTSSTCPGAGPLATSDGLRLW